MRSNRRNWIKVDIEDSEGRDVRVDVNFQICPAEPGVGIMHPYAEIVACEIEGMPWVPDESELESLYDELDREVFNG
jgi:hypothetical protein